MKPTSNLYKTLRSTVDSHYEVQVVQGNRLYGMDKLKSLKLFPMLFDGTGPQIGNACSTKCELSLLKNANKAFIQNVAEAEFTNGTNNLLDSLIFNIDVRQSGSGDPSSENIRPFIGVMSVTLDDYWGEEGHQAYSFNWYQYAQTFGAVYGGYVQWGGTPNAYGIKPFTVVKTHDVITNYSGQTLPEVWYSDRDVYVEGTLPSTGATIVYPLDTPVTLVGYFARINTYEGYNRFVANTGGIRELVYVPSTSGQTWPRMAEFDVNIRLHNGNETQTSEWLPLGTFYTDERSEDKYDTLNIIAYDGMLKTEQYWASEIPNADMPQSWPITARAFATLVENAGLCTFEDKSTLDNSVAFVGLETGSTLRDKLKDIAAAHGSNWIITPSGTLRLIPFINMADGQAARAGIAIVGIAKVGDSDEGIPSGLPLTFLGLRIKSFEHSPALEAISGVTLETDEGGENGVASAGTDTGYVIEGRCNFASPTGVGALCLSGVEDYVYKPFDATGALLDPAADVGDIVIIDGHSYQIMTIAWNINSWPTADISAPYDEEVDHEYTMLPQNEKTYRKAVAYTDKLEDQVEAEFEVVGGQINAKVSKTGGENVQNSFSWSLTDTGHYWYANGAQDPVVSITASGLAVRGEIHATSGYIGSDSNGFAISASSISNGMTSFSDTSHNGVYIGTDGIALGGGKFKVDSQGNITASSGTFTGNVYAENIKSTGIDGYGGYFSGSGIATGTITGGYSSGLPTGQLAIGPAQGVAYGFDYNNATQQGTSNYPRFFTAGRLISMSDVYADDFLLRSSVEGESDIHLATHYHSIIVDDTPSSANYGRVTIGSAYNALSPPSFRIADTHYYQDGVSAVTVASTSYQTTGSSSYNTYDSGFDNDIPYASLYSDGSKLYGRVRILNSSNGLLKTIRVCMPDRYSAGESAGAATAQAAYEVTSREVLTADSSNINDYTTNFNCDLSNKTYNPSGTSYQYGRINIKNAAGNILKKLRVQLPYVAAPSGTKSITSNGTHDVSAYAYASVNVTVSDRWQEGWNDGFSYAMDHCVVGYYYTSSWGSNNYYVIFANIDGQRAADASVYVTNNGSIYS